jgi:hypothetical protein
VVDIPPEIDAPHEGAGSAVVAIDLVRVAAWHLTAWIDRAGRMLHDKVVGAVAIQIADAYAIDALHVVSQLHGVIAAHRWRRPRRATVVGTLDAIYDRDDTPSARPASGGTRVHETGLACNGFAVIESGAPATCDTRQPMPRTVRRAN